MTITSYDQLVSAVITTIASVLLAVVTFLIRQLWNYLLHKSQSVRNDKERAIIQAAIQEADHVSTLVLGSAAREYDNLKAQNNGTISVSDFWRIKNQSISEIKVILSQDAQSVLNNHFGNFETYLSNLVSAKANMPIVAATVENKT